MRSGALFMRSIKRIFFAASFARFWRIGLCVSEVLLVFSFSVPMARAAADNPGTHVSGDIATDTTWDLQGSPYIFDGDVNVLANATLRVMPGVKISMAPDINAASWVVNGALEINGSADRPIDISGIDRIFSSQGIVSISYANLHGGPTLVLFKSTATVASSTILDGNGSAFYVWGSTVNAWNIRIENASVNAIFGLDALGSGSSVSVRNSAIVGNARAIDNFSRAIMRVENNWWGSADGPATTGANSVKGRISYAPWLASDPIEAGICCSSILFIPGIEGTRMYSGSNKLWEPDGNADVIKLYLDVNGSSTDPAIFPGDPIAKAYGIKDVYGKFLSFLDDLAQSGVVNEARALGYDWRRPISEIATDGLLSETMETMASSSKTGKVTLIAHSNGGLIAKYLVKTLADAGKSDLVDAVISVAVPYLGTPEALAALLHGDRQSILGGFILSEAVARGLGENMSSAYSLLPAAAYFERIFSPTIAFASTTIRGLNDGAYPDEIKSHGDQSAFILDDGDIRMRPSFTDVSRPLIGNKKLLRAAESLHALLDPFKWPEGIAVWAITGWNSDTATGIKYHEKRGCNGILARLWCRGSDIFHRLATSLMGDGTVLVSSATHDSDEAVSMDLQTLSDEEGSDTGHVNILEASTTKEIVKKIVLDPRHARAGISRLPGVSVGGRPSFQPKPYLTVIARSMVELHVYDSLGRHTGLVARPIFAEDNDFVVGAYETNIPGSRFEMSDAENDPNTYIKLPTTDGERYSIVIRGKDYGFFTFGLEKSLAGDESVEITDYAMEPTSPLMIATTTIDIDETEAGNPLPVLNVDIDGDGSPDYEALPGGTGLPGNATTTESAEKIAREQSLEVLEKTDTAILRDDPRRKEFIKKLFPSGGDGRPTTLDPIPSIPSTVGKVSEQKTPPEGDVDCELK